MNDIKLTPTGKDKSIKLSKKISLEPIDISQLDNIIQHVESYTANQLKQSIKILAQKMKEIINSYCL